MGILVKDKPYYSNISMFIEMFIVWWTLSSVSLDFMCNLHHFFLVPCAGWYCANVSALYHVSSIFQCILTKLPYRSIEGLNWKTTSFLANGRQSPFFGHWKTTSFYLENGRRPQFFWKWKSTLSILITGIIWCCSGITRTGFT